jgi:hypothetical protein
LMQFFSMTWLCLAAKSFQKYDEEIPAKHVTLRPQHVEKGKV